MVLSRDAAKFPPAAGQIMLAPPSIPLSLGATSLQGIHKAGRIGPRSGDMPFSSGSLAQPRKVTSLSSRAFRLHIS